MIEALIGFIFFIAIIGGPIVVLIGILQRKYELLDNAMVMFVLGIKFITVRYDEMAWIREGMRGFLPSQPWRKTERMKAITIGLKKPRMFSPTIVIMPKQRKEFFAAFKEKVLPQGVEVIE